MRKIHQGIRRSIISIIDLFYPLFNSFFSIQTFRYAACGGVNTLLDIALFAVSYHFVVKKDDMDLGLITLSPHIAALLLGFCVSLPIGYYLNRYVVFQQSGLRRRSQLLRFLSVVIMCISLNYLLLKIFVDGLGWYATPSKVLTTILVAAFSYLIQTYILFKNKQPIDAMG
ncbi:GtrA family protein [Mucilaginibacter antarcticus]|uniref:GtrA family protein n=1 Tax=Mucilaginibacter antarcticus TaxID=1855725 RepID=A0ABW5XJ32_9SPHI